MRPVLSSSYLGETSTRLRTSDLEAVLTLLGRRTSSRVWYVKTRVPRASRDFVERKPGASRSSRTRAFVSPRLTGRRCPARPSPTADERNPLEQASRSEGACVEPVAEVGSAPPRSVSRFRHNATAPQFRHEQAEPGLLAALRALR